MGIRIYTCQTLMGLQKGGGQFTVSNKNENSTYNNRL